VSYFTLRAEEAIQEIDKTVQLAGEAVQRAREAVRQAVKAVQQSGETVQCTANRRGKMTSSAGILEQLTWARNREGIGLSHIKRRGCSKAEEAR
jgi:hypothetical protein